MNGKKEVVTRRYEIRSQLGAGGMGEVYLAEDTRLHQIFGGKPIIRGLRISVEPIALNDPVTLSAAAYVYAKAGERHKALEILSEIQRLSSQEYEPAFHIAQIYLGLGDNEQAFAWLDKACDERSVWLIWLGVDPKFDPLRSDPRFEELLKKIRFPH